MTALPKDGGWNSPDRYSVRTASDIEIIRDAPLIRFEIISYNKAVCPGEEFHAQISIENMNYETHDLNLLLRNGTNMAFYKTYSSDPGGSISISAKPNTEAGTDYFFLVTALPKDGGWNSPDRYSVRTASDIEIKKPEIHFTHVPEYPNFQREKLEGVVTCITPENYKNYCIAVYIRVEEIWWTKPYELFPLTDINMDGTWTCLITSDDHGNDSCATEVAAYLLPVGIEPVVCMKCYELPIYSQEIASTRQYIGPLQRTLSFCGFNWKVKRADCPFDPGHNFFSDREEDIWVDDEGLHLTISERGGIWYCTEVILDDSFGYGTYMIKTHGRVDTIDPMMVLGLFTFDVNAHLENYRELDFEFSRFGNDAEETNAQFAVQPCDSCPGCGDLCSRFRVDLTDEESDLTNYLVWQPGSVEFRTYYGNHGDSPPANALVHRWIYEGDYLPEPGNENIRFNFWLHSGNMPLNGQGDQVIITDLSWQQEPIVWPGEHLQVFTNIVNYPITGCIVGSEEVIINDETVLMDDYYGFRKDVSLNPGLNIYEITNIRNDRVYESSLLEINYDSQMSTEDHTLLYSYNPSQPDTILLDLDGGFILGVLYDIHIVAATHDGLNVIDTKGNVYSTADHTQVNGALPFSQTEVYPVFSNDDEFCYGNRDKIRFADRTLVSDLLPVTIDDRFATLMFDGSSIIIQGSSTSFKKIDLSNDQIVDEIPYIKKRQYWGTACSTPDGTYGFVTSYSSIRGAVDIIDLETKLQSDPIDNLSDYMGQIAFSKDGKIAFVGSYGNSYYGRGGVYVIDIVTQSLLNYYEQFGAFSVVAGPDNLLYVSSRFVDHFGNGTVTYGFKDRRGIDVLRYNENGELQLVKTYYLNYNHRYCTKPAFFIKPGS